MLEGNGRIEPKEANKLYFLLKGKGKTKSGECEY
jgi:hypothetical protein